MKQILNEWNRFLSEGKNPGIDKQLRVPKDLLTGDGFFGRLDQATGDFQASLEQKTSETTKFKIEWLQHLDSEFPGVEKQMRRKLRKLNDQLNNAESKKEAKQAKKKLKEYYKTYKYWVGGHSYGVFVEIGEEAAATLIDFKIKQYVNEAPQADLEFMFANLESIIAFAEESRVEHNQAPTGVTFYGQPTDWWMFGDGFGYTKQSLENARETFTATTGEEYLKTAKLGDASPEPESNLSDAGEERLDNMASMFSNFFAENPPDDPKTRKRK